MAATSKRGSTGASSAAASVPADGLAALAGAEGGDGTLLAYYRDKLERAARDYDDALAQIDALQISHDEAHKAAWELNQRCAEIAALQASLSDTRVCGYDDRKKLLRVIAENDEMRVQEIKDRKKIRCLLAMTEGRMPDETTYFKTRIDQRHIQSSATLVNDDPQHQHQQQHQHQKDPLDERRLADALLSEEDELTALRMRAEAMQIQREEERKAYEEAVEGLLRDRRIREDEEKVRRHQEADRISELTQQIHRLRALNRENTRDVLLTKKAFLRREHAMQQQKAALTSEVKQLRDAQNAHAKRFQTLEKRVEGQVTRKNEGLLSNIRYQLAKKEDEVRTLREQLENEVETGKKKHAHLVNRIETLTSSYQSLKKRRDYEIEGFTNDIMALRKQLKAVEQNCYRYGTLEDRELRLLAMAHATGQKAGALSSEIHRLKGKVYDVEQDVRSLHI
ncbi:hypothetical protein CXG81DRAFT_27221 [Caulochytrium protostelioides]|uniref:DUF4201 domain-containing protein n=1 Tax=Caulochytrium protostelioides TaxID=1555241 RepID=A0A4P9X4P1_9FUNG|nr:hypothetical protein CAUPRSCDRAFT_7829 [Caulochytrium protostelioides]RKP00058.1 hypothetical protein CXG81DRAFT_27221 [Caulochytrium protostelioides]|eukprot:RKP00058.1 hypothetical protein CXG81DRAFT_27221 [Caulochytrium protostelioides]